MERSYRIKANVGVDQMLNVNLKQDIDVYEILSLTLKQENFYKLHSAGYGVIVGRVLANDAFGVPNVKVTAFIPLSDVDELRPDIRAIYPYKSVTDVDKRSVKFNTLPNYKKFDCHQEVGSFPKKQLVLDDETVLEVYDKYYKYTTVTNKAGDYMIFGIPTGEQILHVDVDLSDIGLLSQEPRDFIYKGYSIDLFESPTQFKKGTNIDDLPQIQNQTASVIVYPLWGDKNVNEIAITRKDINLQYKFEPTCVFIGSVITDNNPNSISHNCIPDELIGEAGQLGPSRGDIEMIRKTIDDKIEEYPIKGNQLIDSDGVWCYQIPMNLDYIGMDEYGNIIPTDNPNKGIPTRTRVRFRISLDETADDSLTIHKAKYLVPNNPTLYHGWVKPTVHKSKIDDDTYYEFGVFTPDECFRDMYWNKVYSVKSYVPRLQMSKHEKASNYLAIKGVNKRDARKNNPIPFNKLNLNISIPAYQTLYTISKGNEGLSGFWRYLRSYSVPFNIDAVREKVLDEMDGIGLDFYNDWLNGCLYFPSWFWQTRKKKKIEDGESEFESLFCECKNEDTDNIQGQLFLYNNCSLVYENNDLVLIDGKEEDEFEKIHKFYELFNNMYTSIPFGTKNIYSGIIKKIKTKEGLSVFYYSFGNKLKNELIEANLEYNSKLPENVLDEEKPTDGKDYYEYARLFSTEIILLGSLKDCDIDGIPKIGFDIPSTTSNIPPLGRYKYDFSTWPNNVEKQSPSYENDDQEAGLVSHNGMNWGDYWFTSDKGHFMRVAEQFLPLHPYKYKYGSGLFFGLTATKVFQGYDWAVAGTLSAWLEYVLKKGSENPMRKDIVPFSDIKTCVNAERISELGVTLDSEIKFDYEDLINKDKYSFKIDVDGLITKQEITDIDSRALFATLNFNRLRGVVENYYTGYKRYNLTYFYPTNFDGRLEKIAPFYTQRTWTNTSVTGIRQLSGTTSDDRNRDYLDFRFGSTDAIMVESKRTANTTGQNGPSGGGDSATGGRTYGGKKARSISDKEGKTASTNLQTKYIVYDGYVDIRKQGIPRNRHFYGYDNTNDEVYPLSRNRIKFEDYPFTFPLYENSFYFYFGINQGSTAIDKFYENFYSKCPSRNEKPFIIDVKLTGATACDSESGKIDLTIEGAIYPYDVELYMGEELVDSFTDLMKDNVVFKGLDNGTYIVKITDSYGNTMYEDVVLSYERIELSMTVVRGILTEYLGQSCDDICKHNYYGIVSIDYYILYGNKSKVTSLLKIGTGVYKLSNSVVLEISPDNGGNFNDYVCTCTNEIEGNTILFRKPGTFSIRVYELCNGIKSENFSTYTITVPDVRRLEMYITSKGNDPKSEGVPLKYLVGYYRELIPYNKFFHNVGETVTCVTDVSISGWFGVHNPDVYDELFREPVKTDMYKVLWGIDTGHETTIDFIKDKFEYMFNLSTGTYITAGGNSYFKIDVDGGEGSKLIRSAMPVYKKFNKYNTEKKEKFNFYVTNEKTLALSNEFNPNIVSENYRYVSDDVSRFPVDCDEVPIGDKSPLTSGCLGDCHRGYDFNPKYKDKVNKAANYFAGFDNNANIVQLSEDSCEQRVDYKPYQVIPYKACDLFCEKMCLLSERDDILKPVFTVPHSDNMGEHRRYFRTEFIDRRFDYDVFIITGHNTYRRADIKKMEEEMISTGPCENSTIWDKARFSGLTYNGIEMLYQEVDGKKLIISENLNTEYNYGIEDATISWNYESPKRFYQTQLFYGDGKYVDLTNAFHYQRRTPECNDMFYTISEGNIGTCMPLNECNDISGNEFDNFGLRGKGGSGATGTVYGYPSKRWLHFYKLPYGDYYEFINYSCSYDKINVEQTTRGIKALAVSGECVSFKVEGGEIINLKCGDFTIDCEQGTYNIKYKFEGVGQCVTVCSILIKELRFQLSPYGSDGFRTRVRNSKECSLGLMVCRDMAEHPLMSVVKHTCGVCEVASIIENHKICSFPEKDIFDTDEDYKKLTWNANGPIYCDYEFIVMVVDRFYYSKAADSLMKRIRVLNMSTIYAVPTFEFCYLEYKVVNYTMVIPEGAIDVSSSGETVTPISAFSTTTSSYVDGYYDDTDEDVYVGYTETEGTNTNEVHGKEKYNYTKFRFKSFFLAKCLADVTFKIDFMDEVVSYKLKENNVGIVSSDDDSFKEIGVIWVNHKNLLRDNPGEVAKIVVYMKIENAYKAENEGNGHLEFAFGFTIQGDSTTITGYVDPDEYWRRNGMSVIDDVYPDDNNSGNNSNTDDNNGNSNNNSNSGNA